MADETPLHRPQAIPAGAPAPTPESVDMDEVKSIIGAVDTGNVTGTGDAYVKMAARLDEHAANLVAHAEALAGIWRGENADRSLDTLRRLHTATTAIGTNVAEAGDTYKWLGTTILPFYKSSARTMTDGFINTDGDDERARELLDRMNDRVAEANNGLPGQLSVTFPDVQGNVGPGDGGPGGPGGSLPYTPYGGTNPDDYGAWTPDPHGGDPGDFTPGGNGPGGNGPGGSNQPGAGWPGGPNGPGGPGGQNGPGKWLPGNGTDLAGTGPNPGIGQNPFNLNAPGPGTGLPNQPLGPSPYGPGPGPGNYGGFPGLGGPRGTAVPRPPAFNGPRIGPGQGPNGVIGAVNEEAALSARAAQQASLRGQAGMPIGGSRGGGADGEGEEHTRTTWLSEDEEVWGADSDVSPPVIG